MLLLPIGVLIWGENGNDELSLNDRILSFDAKWKMQTALYVIHLTAVVLSCALLLRLNNTYNLMQQRTWLPATLLLFFNSCVPAFAHTLNVGILLSPILILLLYLPERPRWLRSEGAAARREDALRDIPIARTASSLRHRIACRLGRTDMAGIRLFIDTFCSGPRLYADIYMAVGNSLDIGCTYPGMVVLLHLCRIRPCPDFSYRIFFSPDRRRKYHRYKKHGISRRSDHHRHMLRCIGQLSHDTP